MAVQQLVIPACGHDWIIERTGDLDSLWEAMGEEDFGEDERIPYWVELWPSSLLLASWLGEQRERIHGHRCLDLGCGLGLTALVGTSLGARVTAMDYEPEALRWAGRNTRINADALNGHEPLWTVMDWRNPAVVPESLAFIWGGDVMYERRFIDPVSNFLDHALAPGGTAWIAEPNRCTYPEFREHALSRGWRCEKIRTTPTTPLGGGRPVTVNLWELRKD